MLAVTVLSSHPRLKVYLEILRTCSSSSWWTPSVLSCKSPWRPEILSVVRLFPASPVNPPQLDVGPGQDRGSPGSPVDESQLPEAATLAERHNLGLVNEDVHRPLGHDMFYVDGFNRVVEVVVVMVLVMVYVVYLLYDVEVVPLVPLVDDDVSTAGVGRK